MGSLLDNLRTSKPASRAKSRAATTRSKRVSKVSAKGKTYTPKKIVKPGKPGKGKGGKK
tara:strand:- start:42 stop:218 length:177 start_codon:yes stop_codon:yes gene_type:complete